MPFVLALASVWQEPHLDTNCCLPMIRFALSAALHGASGGHDRNGGHGRGGARAGAGRADAGAAGADGRRLLHIGGHSGAELYPNGRAIRRHAIAGHPAPGDLQGTVLGRSGSDAHPLR